MYLGEPKDINLPEAKDLEGDLITLSIKYIDGDTLPSWISIKGFNLEFTPNDLNDLGSYIFAIILSDDELYSPY